MALLLCLLWLSFISVTPFAQSTPIKEEILDSTSQEKLEWISRPQNAWEKVRLKLGPGPVHYVYQGCNPNFKSQLTTLWTTWLPRKDAHELLLNLQFAQDDRTPVTILLLETDEPVVSFDTKQRGQEVVAPSPFNQITEPKDLEEHLYAEDLNLGKISKTGFHLGFSYSGSCMLINAVRLFYTRCPGFTMNQTSFEESSAGSGLSRGQCVDGADEVSTPKMECQSNGTWGLLQGSCVCGAGFQAEGNICQACRMGSYKPTSDSEECRPCPSNSRTHSEGASKCDCKEGYDRLQDDPPHLGCTKPPSAPLNLTVHHLGDTMLILNWATPADLGGREEVMYDVECRQNTEPAHDPWVQCGASIFILPQPTGLTKTVANITGMHPHVSYKISVHARNRLSAKYNKTESVQSITVWKTPVIISPAPVTTAHSQQKGQRLSLTPPTIAGVLCGVLLLLALIPAAFCFLRRNYHKLSK
ncbi:hypothetical protein NFI96_011877 [Prochilodus magdalenae]|nr:hypothetical protein NFI96_011877 [Prochilodus magdalenae]